MGNCVRREIGYEIDDETDAPEIIDKIKLMKNKTKAKQNFKFEEKLSSVEMNDDEFHRIELKAAYSQYIMLSYIAENLSDLKKKVNSQN